MQKRILLILSFFIITSQAKAQQWRVVKKVQQNYNLVTANYITNDSTNYFYDYNSNRGSSYNNDTINCDKMMVYAVSPNLTVLEYEKVYKYNTNDEVNTIAKYSAHPDTKQWVISATDTVRYNNGIRTGKTHHKLHYTGGKFVLLQYDDINYTYNVNGLVANIVNTSINRSWNYYLYDTARRLILDSSWLPNPTVPTLYIMWQQTAYKYDTSGKLIEKMVYHIDTPQNSIKSTEYYMYDNIGLLVRDSIPELISKGVATNRTIHSYTYTSSKQLAIDTFTMYHYVTKRPVYSKVIKYSYTSFGRIENIETILYDTLGKVTAGGKTKYYYEHYWPLEVPNTSQGPVKPEQELTLFPNPATDNLKMIWVKKGLENVEGRIVDITGHVLQTWKDATGYYYYKKLNTSELSPGNYFVELQTNLGKVHKQFVIIR